MLFSFCSLLTSSILGVFIVIAALFSVPLGLFTAYLNFDTSPAASIFNGLCSFFVPFYGMIYSIYIWLF